MTKKKQKPKVAIYDFTDCEGCQVKLVSLRERLLALLGYIEVVNWRLGMEKLEQGPYDVAIIEGAPITQHEIDTLKMLRENSKIIIAFGSCASLGGIPAMMPKEERAAWYEKIYGAGYKPKSIDALPLSAYVKIDFSLHGCPVNEDQIVKAMEELLSRKTPTYRGDSVCFECKQAGNKCRLAEENKPCLGPIGQAGCKAVCISGGSPCYACFGIREDANIPALKKRLAEVTDQKTIERYFSMFHRITKETQ